MRILNMQVLSTLECLQVTGGLNQQQMIAISVSALTGGVLASKIMSILEPLSTAVGVVGSAVVAGGACTVVAPGVGTVVCGSAGAIAGYFCSATIVNVAAFGLGAIGAGFGAYSFMV